MKTSIYRITFILFFWLLGLVMGGYYFYAVGVENINNRLVLSAYNDGYTNGHIHGSSETIYVLFEDYIKSHPYNITNEMFKQKEGK